MISRKNLVLAGAVLGMVALSVGRASAAVLLSDDFSGTTTGFSAGTLNTVNGQSVLDVASGNTTDSFSAQSLGIGDSITFSFDAALATQPTTPQDRAFKLELANSATSPIEGYVSRIDVGAQDTSSANKHSLDVDAPSSTTSGLFSAPSADVKSYNDTEPVRFNDTDFHHVVLTVTRTDTAVMTAQVTFTNADSTGGSATVTDSASTALTNFTFDEVALTFGSEYYVDNVQVNYTPAAPAPEPASLGLLGVGAVAMLKRRRKA